MSLQHTLSLWKAGIETGFGKLGLNISKYPKIWLTSLLTLIVLLAAQLSTLKTDTAIESFLAKDDPAILLYNAFRQQFGRDEFFVITIEVDELFDETFLNKFRSFHQELEDQVPHVEAVDSLINARHTYGEDDTLYIEDLFEETLPSDPQKLQSLKDYTYHNQAYQSYLISKDQHLVSIMVKLVPFIVEHPQGVFSQRNLEDTEISEAAVVIDQLIAKYQNDLSDDIRVAGSPSIGIQLNNAVKQDFIVFSSLAIVLIGIVLMLIFRRLSGMILPIFVMIFGVTCTISTMALFNTPMQMTTSILPSFLLAVCVGDSIHLLSIFYQHYDKGETKQQALAFAMEHTGLPMFFTSITTAAGLFSFSTSELFPVANLGIYGAIGTLYAFALTVLVLPCFIALLPLKRRPLTTEKAGILSLAIDFCVHLSTQHPKKVTCTGITLLFVSAYLALQLGFTHDPITWFDKDHPVRLAVEKTEQRMGGTMPIEIVIDTGIEGGATNPALLEQLDRSTKEISTWTTEHYNIAKIITLNDVLKETHRALNGNKDEFYAIPDDQKLIRQELFLVEMDAPDELYLLTDNQFRLLRMTIIVPWVDSINYTGLISRVREHFSENYTSHEQFKDSVESVTVTGLTAILAQTFSEMLVSTAQSYALAGAVISLMMIVLLGSLRTGLLSMLPSLLPITMVLALMQVFAMPLDMFTLLIGSIAIGLTVDDTVHFMHGFRRAYHEHGDPARAISETLHSTGKAMLVTTIVLALGFLIYTQSTLNNMFNFGTLTALCIILALVADFILAPALMMLAYKKRRI